MLAEKEFENSWCNMHGPPEVLSEDLELAGKLFRICSNILALKLGKDLHGGTMR